jgi:hypothetical protein
MAANKLDWNNTYDILTTICDNPSLSFVRSRFLVSYRVRSAIKTTAPRTAPHLKYIQGIDIPNKASFEILAIDTGLNWNNETMAIIRDF